MTKAQEALNNLKILLNDTGMLDDEVYDWIETITKGLISLRNACQSGYDWLEGAPTTDLEVIEYAVDENAPIGILEKALGY